MTSQWAFSAKTWCALEKQTALQFQTSETRASELGERPAARCSRCSRSFGTGARFCPYDGEALEPGAVPAEDSLIGSLVDGRFEVVSLLGEGGMGVVYRVRHRVLGREFALKALRADLAREEHLGERFLREAQSAASINHPNVCEITDFGTLSGGRPYFVMELLSGDSLSVLLKQGRFELGRVVLLGEQIARALDAAHRAGVVHRDLKPENIVVERTPTEERVKVVDFGLAQIAGQSRLTQPGIVFGTPHYMSPEQASGGDVDPRADIYALGIMMYEMLTGRVPFEAETYMGVLSKHLYLEPDSPSSVAPDAGIGALEGVVLRCLKKRPEDRYASMSALLDDMRGIVRVDAGQVSVRPGELPSLDVSSPPAATRTGFGALFVGVSLALGIALLVGLVLWERSTDTASAELAPPVPVPEVTSQPVPAVLASRPAPQAPSGGTPEATATTAEPRLPKAERRVGPPASASSEDPGTSDARLPKRKKRSDFQTSEIIDPWSQ